MRRQNSPTVVTSSAGKHVVGARRQYVRMRRLKAIASKPDYKAGKNIVATSAVAWPKSRALAAACIRSDPVGCNGVQYSHAWLALGRQEFALGRVVALCAQSCMRETGLCLSAMLAHERLYLYIHTGEVGEALI